MRKATIISVLLALALGACNTPEASGPPEIKYGRDICEECGMIIDDERFAAGYRRSDGSEQVFDDLGGLLVSVRGTTELNDTEVWVHDYQTKMWIRTDDAFFVRTDEVVSPMGYGILSFSDEARAVAFTEGHQDEVLNWASVLALRIEVPRPGNADMTTTTQHKHTDS